MSVLEVDPDTVPALLFALEATRDGLAARAIVAEAHDPDLGRHSAAEYRADIDRLAGLLAQLGIRPLTPDPQRAAIVWIDHAWTIEHGRPVPLAHHPDGPRANLDTAHRPDRTGFDLRTGR